MSRLSTDPEVIVVGLGSMGSAAALQLARRGVRVVGVDRFAPPHGRGAHSGGTRILRTAYMEGAQYVGLARAAFDRWEALEKDSGESLLSRTGALTIGERGTRVVDGVLATVLAEDLDHEVLDAAEVHRRFGVFTPTATEIAIFEEAAGLVRPEAAITAQLRLAAQAGAELRTGVTVEQWAATGTGVTVWTSDGRIDAERLVLAPGAWASQLVGLPVDLRVERRVQHYWRPAGDGAAFGLGRLPVWMWATGTSMAYGLPDVGAGAKSALHHPLDGDDPADPDVGVGPARPDEADELRTWLDGRLPALAAGEWLGAVPCLYTLTQDEHFVLSLHPEHPNVAIGCGFSGHGFKFVPVIGEILADLVLTGTTPHRIDTFDPARLGA